jgi:hypothetical protein
MMTTVLEEFPSWLGTNTTLVKLQNTTCRRGFWIYRLHVAQLVIVYALLNVRPLFSDKKFALPMHPPLGTIPWMPHDQHFYYELNYISQVSSQEKHSLQN